MAMTDRRRIGIVLLIILVVVVGGYYLPKVHKTPRPNVLWITMDSLRADHLGCTGYRWAHTPNIDALAYQGALFTQAVAQSNYTRISVPSMITGKYPTLIDVRTPMADLDSLLVTLAEILSAEGYATYAVLPDLPSGIYQGLETLEITEASTVLKTQVCLDMLNRLDQRPFFLWLYYWDPHAPYQPPKEFAALFQPPGTNWHSEETDSLSGDEQRRAARRHAEGYKMILKMLKINQGTVIPTQDYPERLIRLYDAEIAFVDSKLKEVLDRIKELGLWEDTIVILNADHGEAFGEHGYYYHGYSIYEEEVRVPLIVKPPKSLAQGKVVEGPVRNLDIMPTILDYCGIRPPEDLDGKSLRPFIEGDLFPNFPSCIETNTPERKVHLVGYRRDGYKLICGLGDARELYDLREDPGERENLLDMTRPGAVGKTQVIAKKEQELREALLNTYGMDEVPELMVTYPQRKMDPELREKLRAQGYIY